MNATLPLPDEPLLPQPAGGNALGAMLALGAHAALLLALFAMTQWRMQVPEVVSAELWSSVPEVAAPAAAPPVAPPPTPAPAPAPAPPPPAPPQAARSEPPPPQVDIATEQAEKARAERLEKERLERERLAKERAERERREAEAEALRRRQAEAEKLKREQQQARQAAAAEQARVERAREEQLRRMMSQAGGTAGTADAPATASSSAVGRGTAARDAAPSASYAAKLAALIRSQTFFTGDVPGNPAAEVEVRAATNGTIISRRLLKSSGHTAWDEAVLRAIDRVGTLPRDTDGRVPSTLIIAFRPKE